MNTESHSNHDREDDESLTQLLLRLDHEIPAPHQDTLDRVNSLSAQAFMDASEGGSIRIVRDASLNSRRISTIRRAIAGFATAACLMIVLWSFVGPAAASVSLGSILDKVANSKSLRLKVSQNGVIADVVVQTPAQVRWVETPATYRIAQGNRLWVIDADSNTAVSQANPWFDPIKERVDLLAMIGIEGEQAAQFRALESQNIVEHAGRMCHTFRMTTKLGPQSRWIEAFVDVNSGDLLTIAAWPADKRGATPLAELTFVARDIIVDESSFVVAKSLSEDGRVGKVVNVQGIVALRPVNHSRWTPISSPILLKPGDWLRTDVRGANAVAVTLTSQFKAIVGPGSLIEIQNPNRIRLHSGEVAISHELMAGDRKTDDEQVALGAAKLPDRADPKVAFELYGPTDQFMRILAGKPSHVRVEKDATLKEVLQKPSWLAGFEGSSNKESIGSLICKVDGRDVPLTVGYHKVNVEIRDQIARTTIEESFVNRTAGTLEGIFHFPLPQDASISGFGMWINNELVEADVVEKQRAREIYETILREKRDPGLLEWTGGNIFKARVFPILAFSEKRIRIVYTQVLPLRENQYRYSYGLRSELLQKTPLRELSLNVQVHSALPLKSVKSPTHVVRSQLTEHSAQLEFSAQEYTPERDFEVVCQVDARQSDVVVVPHRRGEDGYFLVQLTLPSQEGNWHREVLPDGEPLDLRLVCDTSTSMDSEKRRQQEQFISGVLASLGPTDRFNMATCDVDCPWLFESSVVASAESIVIAKEWLAKRTSLGWTNLDRMVESVVSRADPKMQVIYVGDGIVTARDADPQAFINRLQLATSQKSIGTFHAVSVGNSFESSVLQSLAKIGGGSTRQIGGERTPQLVAFELLNEIARPGLRDLQVEFRGLQVAAVYPAKLPNLAAGMQQILIGRYLPQGKNQTGEIVITGQRNGETVRYASRISVPDAEAGNSFIPRLWARSHLDQLLAQGRNQSIVDDIIRLSEEFHIITPYTSLLVLETDLDRERFGVQRRFAMRDGERFFADGRDNVKLDLLQKQMREAGQWRTGLRQQILAELSRLGRDPQLLARLSQPEGRSAGYGGRFREPASRSNSDRLERESLSVDFFNRDTDEWFGNDKFENRSSLLTEGNLAGIPTINRLFKNVGTSRETTLMMTSSTPRIVIPEEEEVFLGDRLELIDQSQLWDADSEAEYSGKKKYNADFKSFSEKQAFEYDSTSTLGFSNFDVSNRGGVSIGRDFDISVGEEFDVSNEPLGGLGGSFGGRQLGSRNRNFLSNQSIVWFSSLFSSVPAAPKAPKPTEPKWSGDALAISRSLLQPIKLSDGGLELIRHSENSDPRWNRVTSVNEQHELYASNRWLSFSQSVGSPTVVQWCNMEERGSYSRAFHTGRIRSNKPRDFESFVPGQRAYAVDALHVAYPEYIVRIERPAPDRVQLILTHPTQPQTQIRITIDITRNVVLEFAWLTDAKVTYSTTYSDYFQVSGAWWPQRIESFDQDHRSTSVTTQTITTLDESAFANRFNSELPNRDVAILVPMNLPTVRESEAAAANGSANMEHRLILLLQAALIQKWDDAMVQLTAFEQVMPTKPGLKWMRAAIHMAARQNEVGRQMLLDQANSILRGNVEDEFCIANYVLDQTSQIADQNEVLRLLDQLQPVFERQPKPTDGARSWRSRRSQAMRSLGRVPEMLALQRELASTAPWDIGAQSSYANDLANSGDYESAYAWLRQEIDRKIERPEQELEQLRGTYASLLQNQGREAEYVAFLEEWVSKDPTNSRAYEQYLGALVFADRLSDSDAIAKQWLDVSRKPGKMSPVDLARANTAVSYALGSRYIQSLNWIDPNWMKPLEVTARYFLAHDQHADIAIRILGDHRFNGSDESDRLRGEVALLLKDSIASIDVRRAAAWIGLVNGGQYLTVDDWQRIALSLRQRWEEEESSEMREVLGNAIGQIYTSRFADTEQLPFMRIRIARAAEKNETTRAASLRHELFNQLLSRPWSDAFEKEALGLISLFLDAQFPSERLMIQFKEIQRFVDAMVQARVQADSKQFQDQGHPERLTRTEIAVKQLEFQSAASIAVADRLTEYWGQLFNRSDDLAGRIAIWVQLERMVLDVRLNRNLDRVAEDCWAILGDEPKAMESPADVEENGQLETFRLAGIDQLFRYRAFQTVHFLAVRKTAPATLIERVEKYIDAGMRLTGEQAIPWRNVRYAWLIAFDRTDELDRQLREWIRTDPFPIRWQLSLGRLLAERGKIDEAILLFESIQRATQLIPSDYATLANWYLVVDQRQKYRRAKIEIFKSTEEYQLSNALQQMRQPWYRRDVPLPSELDETVLFAFQALFEKSNQPENYLPELKEFYGACRDFRLLHIVADALVGRTPQQIYPFLKKLKDSVLREIRDEAVADEILKRIGELRTTVVTPIDLRALDLLESMVERQSADVLNQPGPHIDAAVAALQRAFDRQWSEGEIRQMADLLHSLGTIQQPNLNVERLRQLRELHNLSRAGSDDRLFVAWYLSSALFYSHDRREEGIAVMESAVREFELTHVTGWPSHANEALAGYVSLFEANKRFVDAERIVTKQLEQTVNESQKWWLIQRRNHSYLQALREDGQVSLGIRLDLYRDLQKHLVEQISNSSDANHRNHVVGQLLSIYQTAKEKKYDDYEADLRKFAFELFPAISKQQSNHYQSLVNQTSDTLKNVLGPRIALEFLIERIENSPDRFLYTWQDPWQQFGNRLLEWHHESGRNLGEWDPRLLKIVLTELRRDLRSRHAGNRYFYQGYRMWTEKTEDFMKVAEETLSESRESGRSVAYIAEYIYHGLSRHARAIEILQIAHDKKLLDTAQQVNLCDFLHAQNRHGESISILQPIVKSSPEALAFRTRLITAYKRSNRPEQMRQLLTETDAYFRQLGRWTESNIALLASNCLENELFTESVGYYGELIPLHQRTAPNRGIGNGKLSNYYLGQARAYSGLGETKLAVEAASGAVIAWGPRHADRNNAIQVLEEVLSSAKDLDQYVDTLDQETTELGQDSPLIRRQIGIVYARRNQHIKAIVQLRKGVELQPTDLETRKKLIESYDAINDPAGAVRETLGLLDIDRHNLELFKRLADRLKSDEAQSERAATSIVEAAPLEADHHQALAELRQNQSRWPEAILLWQNVVRLKSLEPTGLVNLAKAQIHERQFVQAQETLDQLSRRQWPSRFSDVQYQVKNLQRQIATMP